MGFHGFWKVFVINYAAGVVLHRNTSMLRTLPGDNSPVLRIDNQQNFKIMKILILLKSFISLFYIIRYILRSMM